MSPRDEAVVLGVEDASFPPNEALLPCPPRSAPPEEAVISTSSLARPQATSVSDISPQQPYENSSLQRDVFAPSERTNYRFGLVFLIFL
jgi:hypothetical protein